MKLPFLMLVLVASALAEVPAKSVVGNLTVEVTDMQIVLPYGTETRALITVCTEMPLNRVQISSQSLSPTGAPETSSSVEMPLIKAGTSYCAATLAPSSRARLVTVGVNAIAGADIIGSFPDPPVGENKASKLRF